jgi:hypothetical protein
MDNTDNIEKNDMKTVTFNVTNKARVKELTSKRKQEKNRKRVEAENWTFSPEYYLHENQMKIINDIYQNNYNYTDDISKIAFQQINRKIYGYKQQDIIKNLFVQDKFINLNSVINKMIKCELKCYYCSNEMSVLYDISREAKQWSVDRIDNDLGHNLDNYYLACLECNLKRRRRSDDKFLFTKQLKLIKMDNKNDTTSDNSLIH